MGGADLLGDRSVDGEDDDEEDDQAGGDDTNGVAFFDLIVGLDGLIIGLKGWFDDDL